MSQKRDARNSRWELVLLLALLAAGCESFSKPGTLDEFTSALDTETWSEDGTGSLSDEEGETSTHSETAVDLLSWPQNPGCDLPGVVPRRDLALKIEVDLSLADLDRYRIRQTLTAKVSQQAEAVTLFGENLSLGEASAGYAYDGHTATFCVGSVEAGDEVTVEVEYDVTPGDVASQGMKWGLRRRDGAGLSVVGAMNEPYYAPLWLLCPQSLHKVSDVYDDSPQLDWVELTVIAPDEGWRVFGPGGSAEVDGVRHVLRETKPMPLYALSLAASPDFQVLDIGTSQSGLGIRAAVSPSSRSRAAIAFEPAITAVEYMEDNIGPYSFSGDLYLVEIPRYPGGMEHVGAIWMGSPVITPDELGRFVTVHEVVHMWWGNAVRFADWPHFWLAEGFDEWSTNFNIFEEVLPADRFAQRKLQYRRDAATLSYTGFLNDPAGPLRFADSEDMLVHFNTDLQYFYVYGAAILDTMNTRLLRRKGVGLEPLLTDWFAAKRYTSVTTEDFLEFVGDWTGEPDYWSEFFDEWIYRAPCPTISLDEYAYSDGKVWLSLSRSGGEQRIEELELVFDTGHDPTFHTVSFLVGDEIKVDAKRIEVAIEVPTEPSHIAVDPEGFYVLRLQSGRQWKGPSVDQVL